MVKLETYSMILQNKVNSIFRNMVQIIASKNFYKTRPKTQFKYLEFCEKLLNLFKKQDTILTIL